MQTVAEYEAWKAKQQQAKVSASAFVVGSSAGSPDELAGDLQLATDFSAATGNPTPPAPMVTEYRSVFQAAIEKTRAETILSSSPRLTEWLRNPENATLAKDDLPALSFWESAAIVPRAIASAAPAFNEGFYNVAGTVAALPGDNSVSKEMFRLADVSKGMKDSVAGPSGNWLGRQVQGASQSIGMMAPGLVASVMSGGTATPAVMAAYLLPGAMTQGGQSSRQAMDAGLSPARSLLYGGQNAAAEVLFERIPVGRFLGDIAQGSGFGKILAGQLATELPTEVATTLFQNLNEWVTLNPEKSVSDFVAEQPADIRDTVAQTFLATLGLSGIGAGVTRLARMQEDQGKARDAEARVALFQEMSKQAVNSKLRARMPDRFREFVARSTDGTPAENIYVPADKFVEYMQSVGVDPYGFVDELDGVTRDDLDAALAGYGGDLRIPTATYAAKIAGSEYDAFLMENMRLDPMDKDASEAAEFEADKAGYIQDMLAEAEDIRIEEDRWRAVEEQIHDQVVSQMRPAGLSTERAMAEVQPIVAFYRTRAARMGLTTEEYLARHPLPQIQGAIPQGMQFKTVDDLNRTLAEARNRSAPKADTRQSLLEFIDGYGGVNDVGGEFKARDAAVIKRGPGKKTLRLARDDAGAGQGSMLGPNVGGKRFGYDDVAQAAIEAGFMADDPLVLEYKAALRDGGQVPDIARALFDAVDAELSGNKQTSDQDAPQVDEAYLDEIEGYLNRLGLDLNNTDEEIRAAIEADQAAPDRMYGQDGALKTDTPEFKAWFGGSKVVDADGKPLVVYHGTAADFEAFDPSFDKIGRGFFFGTADIASRFSGASRGASGSVMPVYLSIRNPYVYDADTETGGLPAIYEAVSKAGSDFDGIVMTRGGGEIFTAIAFAPTQIKSVFNRGTFDANDARILYQFAGPQSETADIHALATAKDRVASGADAEVVRRETGWFRGPDLKWRYEITDEDARILSGTVTPDQVRSEIGEGVAIDADENATSKYRAAWSGSVKSTWTVFNASWDNGTNKQVVTGVDKEDALNNLFELIAGRRSRSSGSFNPDRAKDGSEYALGDMLSHDRLFAAYPDLALIPVKIDNNLTAWGQVNGYGSEMIMNVARIKAEGGPDALLSTLLHEVQHLVQRREGFARGGNTEMSKQVKDALTKLTQERRRRVGEFENENWMDFKGADEARRMVGYASMFQDFNRLIDYARMDRPSGVFRHIRNATQWLHTPPLRDNGDLQARATDLYRSLYALPRSGTKRNAFLRNFSFDLAQLLRDAVPQDHWKLLASDPRKTASMMKALERESAKASAKLKPYQVLKDQARLAETQSEKAKYASPFEIYQLLAGEVEARNTENRMRMTEAERAATSPDATATADQTSYSGEREKRNLSTDDVIVVLQTGEITSPFVANSEMSPSARTYNQSGDIMSGLLSGARDRIAKRNTIADQIAADGRPVVMSNGKQRVLVGPNTIAGEKPFRVTYMGADGQPNGHVEAATLRDAAVRAMEDGFAPGAGPTLFQGGAVFPPEVVSKVMSDWRVKRGVKLGKNTRIWRGVSDQSGQGMASYGAGLYTTSSKSGAAKYGTVVEMDRSDLPSNALRFETINDYEIWFQQAEKAAGFKQYRIDRQEAGFVEPEQFIRAIDPTIDGLQIGPASEAIFVTWPDAEPGAGPKVFFQNTQGPRGQISFNMDGSSLIRLFETANLSTLQHETGHLFLTMLQRDAATGDAATVAEYEVIKSWWRENAKAVAADGNRAMPDAKLMPEDVQRAIDLGTTGDMMKDAAIDVGMQEQWARGYEAYQMEGKAPSIELRAVFAKFGSWMISVYKSMVGLNVKINDDIRGVFDRMLATDEEIAKAKASSGETGAVFATAEQMGLTPEEFERFQKLRVQAEDEAKARLQIEIMEPIRRETEKEYMAEKAKVTEATTANLRRAPVFRAIQEMRFGKTFEGEETPIKLDRGIIEDQYGAGYIPFLPGATKDGKGHRNAVFAADGIHPDVAAGMYGFTTGRELLDAMSNAPDINAAIKAEVEAEMYRRHGDPLKDGEIERRALEVLHNDKRGEWMAAELKAVAEVAGVDVALTMKDARASARQALGLMRVKDATAAMRFLAAERKAGNEAARLGAMLAREGVWMQNARRRIATKSRAALRDDATVGAVAGQVEKANASTENYNDTVQRLIDAKRRQLMNHALFMEATKQRVAVEKTTDRIAKLNRSDKRLSGSMTVDHVKAARAIAAKFGMARADSTFDFNAWLEQLTFDDPIRAAALSEAVAAWGQTDKNYRDMTVNEFGALVDSIDNVLETGKRFSGVETAGKRIDREQAVAELTAVFDDRGYADNEAMSGAMKGLKKIMHDAKTLTSSSRAMLRVMETWARTMDNGEQGPFTNYLVRPVMDALGQYFENRKEKMDDLLAIVEGAKSKMNGNAIPAPELRGQGKQPYAFQNKAALLHAILHTGNESNKAKMLIGWGFSDGFVNQTQAVTALGKARAKKDGSPILTKGELDTTRWDAFLDRMIREGMITSEDIDLVNSIWDVFEGTKRPAQSTHKRLKGFYFKEIENSPYQTAAGMLKGGHVPAMIDKEASLDAGRQGDMRALDQSSTSMFPSTGAGFTKSRVENYREPLELNLMLLPSHLDDVLRFTYLEPAIQQTASLVRGRDLRDTMQRADPNLVGDTIMPWLQRTASRSLDTGATTAGRRRWGRTFDRLRSRIGISIMFMNVVNTAQQITGPIVAASEVSPRRLGRALVRMVSGDAPAMRKAIEDASPYMKERLRLVANDSQIALRDLVQDKGVFTDVDRFTQKHGYLLQSAFQSVLDVPVWHGAYDQAIARGMDRDAAIFEADSAVRRFMPDSAPENVTAFAQGSVTWRMITMFSSFFISQANLLGGRMDVIRRTMGWNGAPQAFWAYLTIFALPAIVAQAIADAASGAGPEDEDDDGMMDELLAWFGITQLRYGAAMVPFAGQATLRTISAFNDNPVDDRLSVSPVVSSVETAVRAGASVYGAVADDGSARRATIDGLTVIALVTGIPTGQLGRLLGYGVGVNEGRYDPAGPVDVVQGVVSGRDGTER